MRFHLFLLILFCSLCDVTWGAQYRSASFLESPTARSSQETVPPADVPDKGGLSDLASDSFEENEFPPEEMPVLVGIRRGDLNSFLADHRGDGHDLPLLEPPTA
jgi:hypothetical protein